MPLGLFGEAARCKLERELGEFQNFLADKGIERPSIQTLRFKESQAPLVVENLRFVGEVALTVPTGVLHLGDDSIGNILKRWPEILCGLIATNSNTIYFLKEQRVRTVRDPVSPLLEIVDLYSRCQSTPFFLHPEWADDFLRKNRLPQEYEEHFLRWIMLRSPDFSLQHEKEIWEEVLKKAFSQLLEIYPVRER